MCDCGFPKNARRGRRRFPKGIVGAYLAALLAILLPSVTPALSEDYLLQPGDVLRIDFAGVSGMQQSMPVGPDGTVNVPLVGLVPVTNRSIRDISEFLRTRLASKALRQVSPTGDEFLIFIDPDRIMVSVEEYRPVYLSGDVARPGEQRYRPGLTVRQAVSLAGGYAFVNQTQSDMFLQSADFRAEHVSLLTQFAREKLRIARIRSELSGADKPPDLKIEGMPLPQETMDELARIETELFLANRVNQAKERKFLESEIENTVAQLATIKEQQEKEYEGLEADTAELQRHVEMEQRGITTSSRVVEARRNLLMSSTRYLQATVQIGQFSSEETTFRRRLQQLEDENRSNLLGELQDAFVRATSLAQQISAVSDKLRYARADRVQRDRDVMITVIRNDNPAPARIEAREDMLLMPGDVVEVALPAEANSTMVLQN